ncbi:MAG: hemerythrin domain-containing protein [Rubrivivax sp.]
MSAKPAPVADQPLDEFSNCHDGILQRLDDLDRLPALLEPAAQARRIAAEATAFFSSVVFDHHAEEEKSLFPAVLASANADEHATAKAIVDRLTREHRDVESAFERLRPHLEAIARGHDTALDAEALQALVAHYRGHARYEESQFLPLAQRILGRNGDHLAALGADMHLRRVLPGVMEQFGHRI